MKNAIVLLSLWALAACGMGPFAGEGGGDDNLPTSGTGPYLPLPADFDTPADEPYVLALPVVSLLDPSVYQRGDGGFDIYYTKVDDDSSEIWRADLPSLQELPVGIPEAVLVADSPWEEGRVGGASLVIDGSRMVLYYEGGLASVAIGRAVSSDGGRTFVKDDNNPIIANAGDPHVTLFEGRWYLAHVGPEQERIFISESNDGTTFASVRQALDARLGVDTAFDQLALRSPALHLRTTLSGSIHYGLFYTGLGFGSADEPIEAIGYVGSFDGEVWQRFMGGEPILQPGPSGAGGASPIVGATESLLFFHQLRQGRGRIAVATSP